MSDEHSIKIPFLGVSNFNYILGLLWVSVDCFRFIPGFVGANVIVSQLLRQLLTKTWPENALERLKMGLLKQGNKVAMGRT